MDENDERFALDCIENKAITQCGYQGFVMYINHRIKKRDFLKLVNYNRLRRNLKPIKSLTTAFHRARPGNKGSFQTKRHLGLGIFCCKKSTRTEETENELTHYQRAHKKYNYL